MIFLLLSIGAILLGICYTFELIFILKHWKASSKNLHLEEYIPQIKLSVVIPARNEEGNIKSCLQSIMDCDFPKANLEIIAIDDHSTDDTLSIMKSFPGVTVLELKDTVDTSKTNAFKKEAIQYAIQNASNEVIVQTDADCTVPKDWLKVIAHQFEIENKDFLAGPVCFVPKSNSLSNFECLDILGMMAVTAAGIKTKHWFMANGANMAFRKKHFNQVDINKKFASGDDIHTIQQLATANKDIDFFNAKEFLVYTEGNPNWKSLYKQRIRWATKNKNAQSLKYLIMMLIPFLMSVTIIALSLLSLFNIDFLVITVFLISIKLMMDYYYLKEISSFYQQSSIMTNFFRSSFIHILYIFIIGLLSLFVKNYSWKGRLVQ